ncbi:unnamed protein product, partial [Mesorhabditis spiculigera]
MATSLVLLKPDVVSHPILMKEVVQRLLSAGLQITGFRNCRLDRAQAEQLYRQHQGRFYYGRLVRHITSGPVLALRVSGDARAVLGSSKLFPLSEEKEPTLRQQFAISDVRNVAHNSDREMAEAELELMAPMETIDGLSLLKKPEVCPQEFHDQEALCRADLLDKAGDRECDKMSNTDILHRIK